MSADVVDILRGAGLVPIVPTTPPSVGDPESQAGSRVPTVPAVPAAKQEGVIETAELRRGIDAIRARLLELAAAAYMDAAPVRALPEPFLRDCGDMADGALQALLSMLHDDADRRAGRVPKGDTAAALCQHCGPVWLHPSIVAVLPVIDGWPRALGCPWCFIRKVGLYIPRPPVTCARCRHYMPDAINPGQGMGRCAIEACADTTWPHQTRKCAAFKAKPLQL